MECSCCFRFHSLFFSDVNIYIYINPDDIDLVCLCHEFNRNIFLWQWLHEYNIGSISYRYESKSSALLQKKQEEEKKAAEKCQQAEKEKQVKKVTEISKTPSSPTSNGIKFTS